MLKIENLTKKYGDKTVYENFNLEIEKDKITVILGESGSGKTTLLNVLAHLIDYQGTVSGIENDKISFVFWQNRLVDCLTVIKNLKLTNPTVTDEEIIKILTELGIGDTINLYPKSLSAGMQRRVAIARALLKKAPLVLMDEPFINLDLALKLRLINLIKDRQKNAPTTAIIVTHDIKEAVLIADRIIVLANGKIIYDDNNICDKTEDKLFDILSKR